MVTLGRSERGQLLLKVDGFIGEPCRKIAWSPGRKFTFIIQI